MPGGRGGLGRLDFALAPEAPDMKKSAGPQPKKARRGGRAPRPSHNYRDATRRKDREVGEDATE